MLQLLFDEWNAKGFQYLSSSNNFEETKSFPLKTMQLCNLVEHSRYASCWKQIAEQLKTMVRKLTVHDKWGRISLRKRGKSEKMETMLIFIKTFHLKLERRSRSFPFQAERQGEVIKRSLRTPMQEIFRKFLARASNGRKAGRQHPSNK